MTNSKPTHPEWLTIPTEPTLKKYGLNLDEYLAIAKRQGYKCPICGNLLHKTVHIEHEHVKGWKKMPPESRKMYVRGLVDWFCNKFYITRGITIQRARNVVRYLEEYEKRKLDEKR